MSGRILGVAFIIAVLAPSALVGAQQSQGAGGGAAVSRGNAANASGAKRNHPSNRPCNGNANNCHTRYPNNRYPWWANSVYVNGGSVDNYSATQPPHVPPPNHVNTGGEVFKSIGN